MSATVAGAAAAVAVQQYLESGHATEMTRSRQRDTHHVAVAPRQVIWGVGFRTASHPDPTQLNSPDLAQQAVEFGCLSCCIQLDKPAPYLQQQPPPLLGVCPLVPLVQVPDAMALG